MTFMNRPVDRQKKERERERERVQISFRLLSLWQAVTPECAVEEAQVSEARYEGRGHDDH